MDRERGACRAVIETPQGERCKYDYDRKLGAFVLKRSLAAGLLFPLNFGFVPSTQAEDGDPIDVMVLADAPLPVGCVLLVRLIGAIEAEQTKDGRKLRNDRLVAVAEASRLHGEVRTLDDLPRSMRDDVTAFWVEDNQRRGETFTVIGLADPAKAAALVAKAATIS